jgi:hypothetical protein
MELKMRKITFWTSLCFLFSSDLLAYASKEWHDWYLIDPKYKTFISEQYMGSCVVYNTERTIYLFGRKDIRILSVDIGRYLTLRSLGEGDFMNLIRSKDTISTRAVAKIDGNMYEASIEEGNSINLKIDEKFANDFINGILFEIDLNIATSNGQVTMDLFKYNLNDTDYAMILFDRCVADM